MNKTFHLEGLRLYSPNLTDHWHWGKRRKHKEDVAKHVLAVLGRRHQKQRGKIKLGIAIYHPRMFDKDNMYRSVKPLVDAIKNLGWIEDDSEELLDLEVLQFRGNYDVLVSWMNGTYSPVRKPDGS